MQVILLEKVQNLGNLGDVVKVKDGYARNFLIPTRAARRATTTAIKEFEEKRAELEKVAADRLASAQALGEKMSGRTVHITQKAGVDGRLFGSVTNADVADALNRIDFKVAEGAGAHAERPAQDRRRAHRDGGAAQRRRGRGEGGRARRDGLSRRRRPSRLRRDLRSGLLPPCCAPLPPRGRGGLLRSPFFVRISTGGAGAVPRLVH